MPRVSARARRGLRNVRGIPEDESPEDESEEADDDALGEALRDVLSPVDPGSEEEYHPDNREVWNEANQETETFFVRHTSSDLFKDGDTESHEESSSRHGEGAG